MDETALIVPVPAAERLVADLRERFDPSAAEGVPAHVTIAVPFLTRAELGPTGLARLEAALRETRTFDFTLARVGRFERTAWLAPEPAAPFVAMMQALMRAFPGWVPYAGAHERIVPHLTVADGHADAAEAVARELAVRLARAGPVRARCEAVDLQENRGPDPSWRWHGVHRIALPAAAEPAA
jgi:2'-5' RNA ligase